MKNIWKEFDSILEELLLIVNGKKIAIWGYGYDGWFLEWFFKGHNRNVQYILDDNPAVGTIFKAGIRRSRELEFIERRGMVLFLTFSEDKNVNSFLEKLGMQENRDFYYIKNVFYSNQVADKEKYHIGYFEWLQNMYELDIKTMRDNTLLYLENLDSMAYSCGMDYCILNILNLFKFSRGDAFFDFGCGKGAILILAAKCGIKKLGGVEFDEELYQIACNNERKACLENFQILNDNAVNVKLELDEYNYFYMYNPFVGTTFKKVIENICESYKRRKRKIILIYVNPVCHNEIINNYPFIHSLQVNVDYGLGYANIYILD